MTMLRDASLRDAPQHDAGVQGARHLINFSRTLPILQPRLSRSAAAYYSSPRSRADVT
jgi:hypothetical protein